MRRLSVVLLVALAVAGCKQKDTAPPAAAAQQVPDAAMATIFGKIVERVDAPPYSYVRLVTDQGEIWAAVPQAEIAVGDEITVTGAMPMNDFESKTLNRKFEVVYFGTLAGDGLAAAPAAPGAGEGAVAPTIAAQHAAAAAGPADAGDVKVEKATGADARTVAEIHAQRAALKEKPVTIRGKVVKFNEGIMGRNWVHLRDGTGSAGKDNNITITTLDSVTVGEVVVVKGVVRVDKDFGHGYAYPVIVEEAKITK
jgi:hypothetical protein